MEYKIQGRDRRERRFKTGDKTARPGTKIQDRGQDRERRFKTGTNGNEDSRSGPTGTKIQDRGQDWE